MSCKFLFRGLYQIQHSVSSHSSASNGSGCLASPRHLNLVCQWLKLNTQFSGSWTPRNIWSDPAAIRYLPPFHISQDASKKKKTCAYQQGLEFSKLERKKHWWIIRMQISETAMPGFTRGSFLKRVSHQSYALNRGQLRRPGGGKPRRQNC